MRHEPTLLRRTVQQEHGSCSAPVCAVAENRARQTEPLRPRAQRHRSRTRRRFSESESFRPRVSQIRGHQSVKIPIRDAVGTTIESDDTLSSIDHAGLQPFPGCAAARSCLTKIFLRGTATLAPGDWCCTQSGGGPSGTDRKRCDPASAFAGGAPTDVGRTAQSALPAGSAVSSSWRRTKCKMPPWRK